MPTTINPWTRHVEKYWRSHRDENFKSILQNASKTYRAKKATKKKVTFKKKLTTWHYYTAREPISPQRRRYPPSPSTYRGRRRT